MKKVLKTPIVKKVKQTYTLETKANARRLYLIGCNFFEIGKIIDAPNRTIEKWYINENWKGLKNAVPIETKAYDLRLTGKRYSEIAKIVNKSVPTIYRYITAEKTKRNATK